MVARERAPKSHRMGACALLGEEWCCACHFSGLQEPTSRHHEGERGPRRRAGLGDVAERETQAQECTGHGWMGGRRDGCESLGTGQEEGEEGRGVVSLAEGLACGD